MKVRDVQIDGFGVWSGLSVDSLPEGMTVFYGPNEAGKTTLMNFLRTMLYGFTAERRQRYLPPVHGGKPGGAMRVTGPGGGYEIARRATLNDPSIVGQLTVTSSDGITQGQHRLTSLLGSVDESIFTNVFAIGLRELQELSTLDDTAAADELYKLSSGLDRVSLVDVMRQLKAARGQIVAQDADNGQMQSMLAKREKLRDEIEQLTIRGRRWGELAAHRRNQQTEIDELKQRVEQWELEAKSVETAIQVRDPWQKRDQTRVRLKSLNARVDIPENAIERLLEIQDQIEEKRKQIQAVRDERKQIRKRAEEMPVSKSILSLAGKIEAAGEQGPWISSLQKQIQRLESELLETQERLLEDAKRLGLSEQDQEALLNDKRLANLPDLSRQAISQLAGPARDVRVHQLRLKQAKERGTNDKREADRLASEINAFLSVRDTEDLQTAIKNASELIHQLRKHQQIDDRLEKLVKHRKDMESEAVELASDEALPVDRLGLLAIPFFFGMFMLITGLGKFFNISLMSSAKRLAVSPSDQTNGMLMTVLGIIVLFAMYTWWKFIERGSNGELNDCESQIEALALQIKKTEQERDEMIKSLPEHAGSLEQRIKEAEHELAQCEGLLPIYHNHEAAVQRFETVKRQANDAAAGLKSARSQWKKTLQQIGLAESLSPKSIRILAEGYESLLQTRRRLKTQQDELDQRKLELSTALQRIEALSMQLKVAMEDADNQANERPVRAPSERADTSRDSSDRNGNRDRDRKDRRDNRYREEQPITLRSASALSPAELAGDGPLLKLQDLSNTLAQHQQYISQRKQLKTEDEELSRKQKGLQKTADKWVRARQSHLADLGVEDQHQLENMVALKQEHHKLEREIEELDARIVSIIRGQVPYETVARLLESTPAGELEKRWDTLGQRIQQAEERVSQLLQRQGETHQEMKSLAADRRLAESKLELASLEKQIAACADHWRVLGATSCMLEKVCEVYETERQPETLREASAFLKQLTDGKYVRVWTPLGKNALRIDNENGQSLPLEVLSRGTREAVFIALRLSLAAAYSRRGVTLPLVLDDVLVNFDSIRATNAGKVLRDFASLGHQVIMFTCHEHIMKLFHAIDVQVRVLPTQGQSGEARIYQPHDTPVEVAPKPIEVVEKIAVKPTKVIEAPVEIVVEQPPIVVIEPPAPVVLPPTPQVPVAKEPEPVVPIVSPEPVYVVEQPVVLQQPVVPPVEDDRLWYDYDEEDLRQPTDRVWSEIDQLEIPLEGEPHDLWWSSTERERDWAQQ